MKPMHSAALFLTAAVTALTISACSNDSDPWELVWSDDFTGSEVDTSYWKFEIGDGCPNLCGWGNNELQYYRAENAAVSDGILTITAKEESFGGREYTSARMITMNKIDWTYGRFEARIKLPVGQGLWPAFWLLGSDIDSAGWPQCGEIDIMEYLGQEQNKVHGTVHGPGYSGANGVGGSYTLPSGRFDTDFHVFAVEWEPNRITWLVDEVRYQTLTPDNVPGEWVYDHPFFIIVNMAIGGYWPGPPDAGTAFPQTLQVDWINVYSKKG